jgi:putative membrane protein
MSAAAILPHVTAFLNAVSLVFLVTGFVHIRAKRRDQHQRAMARAVIASGLFLVFYVVYHFAAPIFVFRGEGAVRPIYYALLISHVTLAALVAPMVAVTVTRALRGQFDLHPKIARWTLPLWLYVSVTGIVVYLMLYHIYT